MGCKDCGDNHSNDDVTILPSGSNTPDAKPACVHTETTETTETTKCTIKHPNKICSTIKDECHDCAPAPIPFARIKLLNAIAMPDCNQDVEAVFEEDITNLMVGLSLYAVDPTQRQIRLKIVGLTPDHKLTLRNICSSCCNSTKPVGETILAGTYFSWGIPDCCSPANSSDSSDCLIGTFFFPNSGATAAANVANSNNFVLGGLYSLGGFIWKVTARVTSTQILLENPAPGNGSTAGGFIEGGCDGQCIYPITPISEASECDDSAVDAVSLIGCTTTGKKKLTGSRPCGLVQFDLAGNTFSVVDLLGGSSVTGPHYIQWDKDNPCNSKLISAPDLAGANCSTITEPLFLTPANASNQYEITVANTAIFTVSAPNNIVTLSGRQFTVTAIVNAGAPGKIRLQPRFTVVASETIPPDSQICIVEGCQPFQSSQWPFGCSIDSFGERVFCATDGLRTSPAKSSNIGAIALSYTPDIGGIEALGTYNNNQTSIVVSNPSPCHSAVMTGLVQYTNLLLLDDDGTWICETVIGEDVAPNIVYDTFQLASHNGQRRVSAKMVCAIYTTLAPGQSKTFNILPRLRTTNASPNNNLLWENAIGVASWHVTNT
jgi:hypothetical protein